MCKANKTKKKKNLFRVATGVERETYHIRTIMRLVLAAYLLTIVVLCLLKNSSGVDRNNFKTCEQSSFCR